MVSQYERVSSTAERLKLAISDRGLKASELAERTGVSRASVSCYLSGKYEPKPTVLHRMSAVLGVAEMWLAGYNIPMERSDDAPHLNGEPELTEYLDALRNRSELRALFALMKNASKDEVEQAMRIIVALRK